MRINKFIARATGLSRRAADRLINDGQVLINNQPANTGIEVQPDDEVRLNGQTISLKTTQTIMLNKPVGYVCSREGQGSKTIYDILPAEYHDLKPVGRLDKDSSGLLLLTNDGELAQELTHPSHQKQKIYEIELNKPLEPADKSKIEQGITVEDYISKLEFAGTGKNWTVKMHQGKNRQIRRTFAALGYTVTKLHRTHFGDYELSDLKQGKLKIL